MSAAHCRRFMSPLRLTASGELIQQCYGTPPLVAGPWANPELFSIDPEVRSGSNDTEASSE
jgi:hypothetical protein